MPAQSCNVTRLFILRLNSGEDILGTIRAAAADNGIRHGVILTGVGSISAYHVHVVETTNLPSGNVFFRGEGAFDVLSVTGLILDGRVHAHITFSNTDKAMGGHLEEGCRVLTFAVVVLAETDGADLTGWDRMGRL
jgi:predicted DNA-binding protein with PD1-like motif